MSVIGIVGLGTMGLGIAQVFAAAGYKVLATDAGSLRDFQAFAKQTGNELVEQQNVGTEFVHLMRRR